MSDANEGAVALLLAARGAPERRLAALPEALRPADAGAAYAIQHRVAVSLGPIGGWKVGAAGPTAQPSCSPMPASGVTPSPATLSSASRPMRGIEAEVAFRLGRDLPPRGTPYSREEVIAALAAAHPAIELLESRYRDPDAVDALGNLADGQMHGGFVWGEGVADWHGIDFTHETVEQTVDAGEPLRRTGNPAGDMIRLVVWLANEGSVWAGGLKAGQFVTCGSWTGKTLVGPAATARVRFPSLGEVRVRYTV
jgi:2-keto-4-pentenoate hydratase